jgi:IS30 family transposase
VQGHRHAHRELDIPERTSILKGPAIVMRRQQTGHWENDSIIARRSQAAVNVLVEHRTRLTKPSRLPQRTAREISKAITRTLSHLPVRIRRTITYDKDAEDVEHQRTNTCLNLIVSLSKN